MAARLGGATAAKSADERVGERAALWAFVKAGK